MNQFLNNPGKINFGERWNFLFGTVRFEMYCTASRAFHVLTKHVDTGLEGVVVQSGRQQLAGYAAYGLHNLFEVGVHFNEYGFAFLSVAPRSVELVEVETEDGKLLDEVVVEFGAYLGDDLFAGFHRLA